MSLSVKVGVSLETDGTSMDTMIDTLQKKKLPEIPDEIRHRIDASEITLTPVSEVNELLIREDLQKEAGYRKMEKGIWQVSMYCPMPGITPEMIQWWFWWHPQADERYQVWYPGAHHGIGYANKDREYFQTEQCPPFQNNIQYPVETIGGSKMPLQIRFVTPEEFGFSRELMEENDIPIIVCGHVGIKGLVMHTEMAHVFRKTEDGLYMFSRFWMGELLHSRLIRSMAITEATALGMTEHCCVEYRNLVRILPELYRKYGKATQ